MTAKDYEEVVVRLPEGGRASQVAATVDNMVRWLARHWLAVFNTCVAIFVALPFLAPVFMQAGATGLGRLIYTVYSPTCHQLPDRSFFLFGQELVYSVESLEAADAIPHGLSMLDRQFLRFPGNAEVGYKVAFCERDAAIYGFILFAGLLFAVARRLRAGRRMPKMRLWQYGLFILPMAVDGFTQLFGWRESTWFLRVLTGGLFGFATVWLAYPYVQEAMDDVLKSTPARRDKDTTAQH